MIKNDKNDKNEEKNKFIKFLYINNYKFNDKKLKSTRYE